MKLIIFFKSFFLISKIFNINHFRYKANYPYYLTNYINITTYYITYNLSI